ncbi:hypothetical protein OSB04_010495 [Centaurea solstitialis]|uniref:BURP domain-containing protein n=1 Tax=Centaurea solstitialis TaxID=347529 RepID=A0AA38TIG9_9ASTR|nr:hypothetical protein OSB04_010495 [Centaurea solstitialis]
MEFFQFLTFLSMAMIVSHAAVAPETYWKSVLPNTPIPKSLNQLLNNDKSTDIHVGVGKGGVSVQAPGTTVSVGGGGGVSVHAPGTNVGVGGKGGVSVHSPGTNVGVGKGGVSVHAPGTNVGVGGKGGVSVHAPGTNVGVGKGGVSVHVNDTHPKPEDDCTKVSIGKGGVVVRCHDKKKPVHVEVSPFSYNYAATDDQLKDDPNVALFFLENDMHRGKGMNLHFTKTTSPSSTFLPRKVSDTIPFSSKKLPEIYTRFAIKPDTVESESMKKTISECEDKGMEGEEKYCATSLEAMVDFSTSTLGKKVKAISTEVKARKMTPLQKYTIEGAKKLATNRAVVCHKQNYPYAVFYCHKTTTTEAYVVSLVGADGTKAKAVAVCHTDTAKWNPKHLAFRVLKVIWLRSLVLRLDGLMVRKGIRGKRMNLHFTKTTTPFLPRKVADTIPFSSRKLPEIYVCFGIKPDTVASETIKRPLSECEHEGMEGEETYCATSLASMLDFATSKLGNKVRTILTELNARETTTPILQKYTIQGVREYLATDGAVSCHKLNYLYAVFYCHTTTAATVVCAVSLAGEDGTKAKAVAICHTDTSKWP